MQSCLAIQMKITSMNALMKWINLTLEFYGLKHKISIRKKLFKINLHHYKVKKRNKRS